MDYENRSVFGCVELRLVNSSGNAATEINRKSYLTMATYLTSPNPALVIHGSGNLSTRSLGSTEMARLEGSSSNS